jgi:hypothetical protein
MEAAPHSSATNLCTAPPLPRARIRGARDPQRASLGRWAQGWPRGWGGGGAVTMAWLAARRTPCRNNTARFRFSRAEMRETWPSRCACGRVSWKDLGLSMGGARKVYRPLAGLVLGDLGIAKGPGVPCWRVHFVLHEICFGHDIGLSAQALPSSDALLRSDPGWSGRFRCWPSV